ncbi:MAG: HpcH/HpaI aldolase/citrate lyase family protein [Rhodobacter sp.]|nr:HpcH/HpaI aldolase/citrate lyase family protein [Rhodobacter sp.]
MPAPQNPIKAKLAAGQMQIGAFLDLASPIVAEIAGRAGYDWCLIDGEHGPSGTALIRDQLVALASVGCPAVVRVPVGDPWVIKRALDIGAQTILVPMVDSGEQAAIAARALRYPPEGNRGLAAGVVRASGYGAEPDYMHTANDQICLMVQAESRTAVDNIDAIAATEGVDCVFVGPSDLAADMGHLGNPGAPEVVEAIAHVMARTRAAGKPVAMFCMDPTQLGRYRDMGATLIAVAGDVGLLTGSLRARAAQAREMLA